MRSVWPSKSPPGRAYWGSPDHPQVRWLPGRAHRTQHIIVFTAKIDHSERTQSTISTGRRSMGWGQGETRHKFPRVFSLWGHTGHASFPQQWVVTTRVKCCPQGKLIRHSRPKVLLWARHIGMKQNSTLSEGKYKPHLLHEQLRLSQPLLLFLGMERTFLKCKLQDSSQEPTW